MLAREEVVGRRWHAKGWGGMQKLDLQNWAMPLSGRVSSSEYCTCIRRKAFEGSGSGW